MVKLLASLFYLGVLAMVSACGAYLFITRRRDSPQKGLRTPEISPEGLARSESLSGKYLLSDLESILTRLASLEAWGVVLQLHLEPIKDNVEGTLGQAAVELFSHNLGVLDDHLDRFHHAAATVGLEVHPLAGQEEVCYVVITGTYLFTTSPGA